MVTSVMSATHVEATREYPRQICRGTSDLVLPDVELPN